ncbi:beta-lactamase family protein [Flavobacteriaceae bacterium S0825]|uniref:serine hydrolase domain-containing protein n=1 Tax=Gaetbulibacter sp. S0825 TaxID=2720084 RepID=UPI00142F9CE4|nr:serine hydrolase domain-containing protein [Gaetbulibacter sp. S0825]MCK0109642.1 beta-lactamase family protein [Flavobacteriaceae bacterium S0825]NIX65275.1 beta-lactamase family protein [Gaetbulibacter sp. S0825]
MKNYFLIICCLLSFTAPGQVKDNEAIDKVFADWNKIDAPGAALGIVKNGKLIYAKGYGMADLEHDLPITPSSVFYTGSVSKQFVTFAILLLEEEGKLNLDDEIQVFLPDFPKYEAPLTIRHFIHHTSGVRDYLTLMALKGRSYLDNMEVDEVYELIKSQKVLNFSPGDQYLYSNSCYFMLAMIVEKAAGKSIRDFAEEKMFGPLGMKNTLFYDDNRDLIKNKVFSYEKKTEGEGFNNLIMRFDLVGSGGVYSSIEDLLLWDQNFYNNILGKGGQDIITKMHQEGLLNNGKSSGYAFALNNGTYKGLKTVSHGGSLAGYRAQLMRFPDQSFSVIILANRNDANPTVMSYQVADILLKDNFKEKPEKVVKKPVTPTSNSKTEFALKQMTGLYEIQQGVDAEITIKDGKLNVLQKWNNSSYPIVNTNGNIFEIPNNDTIQFIFSNLKNDQTQVLTVVQNGNKTTSKRKEEATLLKINLKIYLGNYYNAEINAIYQLVLHDGVLKVKIPNEQPEEIVRIDNDKFLFDGVVFRFIRTDGKITGLFVDAGRVKNLEFIKQ